MARSTRSNLRDALPLALPQPCPVCGAKVILTAVVAWGSADGEIIDVEFDCETEPDIDDDKWLDWYRGHYRMPYVDWLPWENEMIKWLNVHCFYFPSEA